MRPTGMDNRLVLSVLFLTLSWMFVGTYGQTATAAATTAAATTAAATTAAATKTTAAATTAAAATTTAAATKTTAAATTAAATTAAAAATTTAAATKTTAAAATTTAAAKTTAAATTAAAATKTAAAKTTVVAATATTAAKTTVVAATATTAAKTTVVAATATTAAKTTAAAATATTAAKTTAAPTTAAPTTTTAAPLIPDTNVTTLATPFSRAECGRSQLCAAAPSSCDPSQSGSCFFLGAKLTSGRNFEFSLSGESDGYLAASLSTDATAGGNDPTYICANDNGTVKFFGALLNNGVLTVTTLEVNNVKGSVNGTKIQCTFAATVPAVSRSRRSLSTRAQSFAMSVSTGPFDSTSDTPLGSPTSRVQTDVVNIANPNAVITTVVATTATTATPTTSHAVTLQQSLMQALLVTVGVLGLAML